MANLHYTQSTFKTTHLDSKEFIVQKFREIHWKDSHQDSPKEKLKLYTDNNRGSYIEVITDLYIQLPMKSHHDPLEVKVDGGEESCILPLRVYRRMFPGNLTNDGFLKPNALNSVKHIILESYADSILQVHDIVILKFAYYMAGKLMPMRYLIIGTKNEVVILYVTSTSTKIT